MTQDTFEQTLRSFLRREPFEQFVIELDDGRQLLIDLPHTVSMGGGGACFMSPEYDFYSFSCEQVRDIRAAIRQSVRGPGMTQDVFQQTLRSFLRREPFEQFVIELDDGRQLLIDLPHTVSIGGGAGGFISPEYEIIMFSCEQVRNIRAATAETAS